MMCRTQLVPRAWTWLGLVGGPLIIISGTIVMFGGNPASAALKRQASIPEAVWELFLGVYCTIWGFKRDAPILSGSVSTRSGSAEISASAA
jgi:peptidoglycan/LPS O-acetylase OafA/YrhL